MFCSKIETIPCVYFCLMFVLMELLSINVHGFDDTYSTTPVEKVGLFSGLSS